MCDTRFSSLGRVDLAVVNAVAKRASAEISGQRHSDRIEERSVEHAHDARHRVHCHHRCGTMDWRRIAALGGG
jgi:hypothetical protein